MCRRLHIDKIPKKASESYKESLNISFVWLLPTCVGVFSSESFSPSCPGCSPWYDLLTNDDRFSETDPCVLEIPSSDRASDWIPLSLESGELMSKPALANLKFQPNFDELFHL